MSMDLAKFVLELRSEAKLTEAKNAGLQKKLIALAIDPLLVTTTLEGALRFSKGPNRAILEYVLGKMTLPQLKKLSKAWNPHRPAIPKEMGLSDLRTELISLLNGAEPALPRSRRAPAPR